MSEHDTAYARTVTALREVSLVNSINFALEWDEQTQMPPGGAEHRAAQKAWLARTAHERFTSPAFADSLGLAEEETRSLPEGHDRRVVLARARRAYNRSAKVPSSLVASIMHTTALAHHAWVDARKAKDPSGFTPWLEMVINLRRQQCDCIATEGQSAYDVLLDEFEPGTSTAQVRDTFASFRAPLVELVGRVAQSGIHLPVEILARSFPVAAQEALGLEAARALGYNFENGRIDVSVHPFSITLGPGDSRITTRYHEHRFGDAFFGVLHETGHALYEQGLPTEHYGTGLGEAVSMGIHESQSRLWENMVGRSRAFWRHFFPKAKSAFPVALGDVSEDTFVAAVNDIRPSLVRVESDEATYNLHILLRFELEQAIVSGDLLPADIPAAWNERMQSLLGITPPDDALGCLQDVHWSSGAFGYFPTYTLGNLCSAQFFEAARRDLGDLDAQFSRGEFSPLREWLRAKIHCHGQRYLAGALVERVTGSPLSADALLRHLRAKAAEYYGV